MTTKTPLEMWQSCEAADIDPDDCPIYRQTAADLLPKTRLRPVRAQRPGAVKK